MNRRKADAAGRAMLPAIVALMAGIVLTGCSKPAGASANGQGPVISAIAAQGPQPSYKPVGEYKGLKLGMSFEDVIGSVDPGLFNPVSLKECFHDIALRGCNLYRKSDDSIFDMREGVPYGLKLDFNRKDKLVEIGLNYHREGGTSWVQCRDILATTIDWVSKEYGPMTYHRPGDKIDAKVEASNAVAKTPGGTSYAYLKPDAKGAYVSQFLHLASETVERKTVDGKGQVLTTNRGVSLFSSYIVVGRGICDVDLEFREPDSVERSVLTVEDGL